MLKKIKKILLYHLTEKKLAIISCVLFLLLMLPIIYIGKYDKPAMADEYWYGKLTHQVWESTHNIFTVLNVAFVQSRISWYTWQGTFSSIFLMSLTPVIFDYRLYKLVPAFMIAIISFSCFSISGYLLKDLLKRGKYLWITVGAFVSILVIEKMYTIPSGIFFWNSAIHYVVMQCFMFLLLICTAKMVQSEKKGSKIVYLILSVLLGIATGGANYATCLMGVVALSGITLLLFVLYRKRALLCLIPVMFTLAAFFLNVIAPGNSVRGDYYIGYGISPISSILKSFPEVFIMGAKWTNLFLIFMLLLMIPVFWQGLEGCDFRFPFPGIVFLFSVCFLASGFTSSFYVMGDSGLSRLKNAVCMTFHILLFINEGYFIGWVRHKKYLKKNLSLNVATFLCALLAMCGSVVLVDNPGYKFTTYISVFFLKTGEAAYHYQEYITKKEILENGAGQDIVLKQYVWQPRLLYTEILETDPNDWKNVKIAEYFGLNSLTLEENQQ